MTPALRDYQQKALAFLEDGGSYLALEQGLGKTRIILEHAKREKMRRILVWCPATVRLSWEMEVAKWWPDGPPARMIHAGTNDNFVGDGVFAASYWTASQEIDVVKRIISAGKKDRFSLMSCDEAHFLKTYESTRTQAIFAGVKPQVDRTILASGTPAPNHGGELYTAFRALAQKKIRTGSGRLLSREEFEERFCKIEYPEFAGAIRRVITGTQNRDVLRRMLDGFMLRMRKKDVLPELPPLEFVPTPIEPSIDQISSEDLARYSSILRADMDDESLLAALRSKDEHVARLLVALGLAKASSAGLYLQEFMTGCESKIVVWAVHQTVIDMLMKFMGEYSPVKIDGRDSSAKRKAAVETFLNDDRCRVFIGNIVAAGTGLTLIGPKCNCSDCFFVESSYTPGENLQAAARIHRLGQQDGVLARVFTARRTIDDRIQAIIARKTNELAEVFG
jgi:SWI/SNF-related matrix-associated actin-dependent regulator 1 of chromatin subfamily A